MTENEDVQKMVKIVQKKFAQFQEVLTRSRTSEYTEHINQVHEILIRSLNALPIKCQESSKQLSGMQSNIVE